MNTACRCWLTTALLLGCTILLRGETQTRVLVFSKAQECHHKSSLAGNQVFDQLGAEHGFVADHTENAADFTLENLTRYRAVIFLNTSGNVLDAVQQTAFERYIQAGGGYVGIHSAAATEYAWPWYGQLVGGYLSSYPIRPETSQADLRIADANTGATSMLPGVWSRTDQWYNFRDLYPGIQVLATLDEESYSGGTHGSFHPIAWQHRFDGGRAFYTGGGHTEETFREPLFIEHLWVGLQYAMGAGNSLDLKKSHSVLVPEESRFEKTVLKDHLASPMALAVANDGRVFFTELGGKISLYDPRTNETRQVLYLDVEREGGTGLTGITLDPDFDHNHFLYVYQSPATDKKMTIFHLSRFKASDAGDIDVDSEKVLLEVPVSRKGGGHHGGSLAWDTDRNLYLSTGDSTAPHPSGGYASLDERQNDESRDQDSQRSAGNTNDLRGKILRIKPTPEGGYRIPEGNLFKPGTELTRPEIYIMGVRNPYRIAVNPRSNVLYWADIGPDAGEDSPRGPKGYDEFDQAFKAGNFGWPYFIADNQPYSHWDFEKAVPGPLFDVTAPRNLSPNNSGLTNLPPPMPAMVWYPYSGSSTFPELGVGGRAAMVGAFYRYDPANASKRAIPAYYDGGLFVFDWMRNWMKVIRVDDKDRFVRFDPFMTSNGDFRRPIHAAFSRDGLLYVLEYGSIYGMDNEDARLVRIDYNSENRPPRAYAGIRSGIAEGMRSYLSSDRERYHRLLRTISGSAPLTVRLTGRAEDPDDGDAISLSWYFDGKEEARKDTELEHRFTVPGVHAIRLVATDQHGATASDELTAVVGNAPPKVEIRARRNRSFFWDGESFPYEVRVFDPDGTVMQSRVEVQFSYSAKGGRGVVPLGETLMAASDCRACHQLDKVSVGPSLRSIATRYSNQENAVPRLVEKVIQGGGGVWGNQFVMSAHPQLPRQDVKEIVNYILSLGGESQVSQLEPISGELTFDRHKPGEALGRYTISAHYVDDPQGNVPSQTGGDEISLRNSEVPAEYVDGYVGFNRWGPKLAFGRHKAHLYFRDIDLTGIAGISVKYVAPAKGEIEVRQHSYSGPLIGRASFDPATQESSVFVPLSEALFEQCDVYLIMHQPRPPNENVITIKSLTFERRDPAKR